MLQYFPVKLSLSRRGDYVVRSAVCLARAYRSGEARKLREISAEMGVPRTFVSQILGDLLRAGLAVSSFGMNGGYRLTRPPGEVSLLELVEAGEGPLSAECCDDPHHPTPVGPLRDAWAGAATAFRTALASSSLAELAETDEAGAGRPPVPYDAHLLLPTVTVADAVQIDLPAAAIARRLCSEGWLTPHVGAASTDGDSVLLRVGPGGPAWLGKTVAVRLGEREGTDEALVIPLAWEATGPSGFFPRLDGQLGVMFLGPDRSELSLVGSYRPPLGRAGLVIDEVLLAHVARATVRSFLKRLALALEEAAAGGVAGDSGAEPFSGAWPAEQVDEGPVELLGQWVAPAFAQGARDGHGREAERVGDDGEQRARQHDYEQDCDEKRHTAMVDPRAGREKPETTGTSPRMLPGASPRVLAGTRGPTVARGSPAAFTSLVGPRPAPAAAGFAARPARPTELDPTGGPDG